MSNEQRTTEAAGYPVERQLGLLVNAELVAYYEGEYMDHSVIKYRLQAFARAIQAAERERCAKLCEARAESTAVDDGDIMVWLDAARLIRSASDDVARTV